MASPDPASEQGVPDPTIDPMAALAVENRYQYTPVDSLSGEIRLLTIHAGSHPAPVEVSLVSSYRLSKFVWAIPDEDELDSPTPTTTPPTKPTYEALSYAWGPPTDTVTIQIGTGAGNDSNKNNLLSITRNLAIALPYLRLPHEDRVLWIDAICINQLDYNERALQVQVIAEIFQEAESVICWAGPASVDSDLAIGTMRALCDRLEIDLENYTVAPREERDKGWADLSGPFPYGEDVMRAVFDFFGRRWFQRLWIFQEVRLAGDRTVMQCGTSSIRWQDVAKANWCFQAKPWKFLLPAELQQRMDIVAQIHLPNPTNLALLIRRTIHLKCTDPRDRVYAMMSTRWKEEQKLQIDVDYKKPIGKVYQDYVQQFITRFNSLRLLSFCELLGHLDEMPTWVPDWSKLPSTGAPRASRYASGNMKSHILSISDDFLEVMGVRVATIEQITPINIGDGTDDEAIKFIRECALVDTLHAAHPRKVSLLEAYCCALAFDTFSCRTTPERFSFPPLAESIELVRHIIEAEDGETSPQRTSTPEARKYFKYVKFGCNGRSLITTNNGHIGIAPASSTIGDYICIIPGCRDTLVLRRNPKAGHYQILGTAYVHGMNHGEPIFGPFPENYEPVLRNDRGILRDLLFLNRKTGEVEMGDPRLRDLDDDDLTEGLWVGNAPKVEALRARGVDFEVFTLA